MYFIDQLMRLYVKFCHHKINRMFKLKKNRMRFAEVMAVQSLLSNVISHLQAKERQRLAAIMLFLLLLSTAMKIKASSFIINVCKRDGNSSSESGSH